jgi:hypothetical protein
MGQAHKSQGDQTGIMMQKNAEILWVQIADGLSFAVGGAGSQVWQSKFSSQQRRYSESPLGVSDDWHQLQCIQSLRGPSIATPNAVHYVVEADVSPLNQSQFDAWYFEEHLPGLASVPGTIRAARYLRLTGAGPKSYACYDLVSLDVTKTAPWLAIRHTAWSDRVRPMFLNTLRTEFEKAAIKV